jgi:hypothetical protein
MYTDEFAELIGKLMQMLSRWNRERIQDCMELLQERHSKGPLREEVIPCLRSQEI